jgi:hypothetical protein
LPPPVLPGGISGSTSPHSSSVRSLGYRNLLRSYRARFLLVQIGDPSSNQATTLESQMIHMIQELFGQTLRGWRSLAEAANDPKKLYKTSTNGLICLATATTTCYYRATNGPTNIVGQIYMDHSQPFNEDELFNHPIVASIRLVFFQTEFQEYPHVTHGGTLFVVKYLGRPYGLTCKHDFGDFPPEQLARHCAKRFGTWPSLSQSSKLGLCNQLGRGSNGFRSGRFVRHRVRRWPR